MKLLLDTHTVIWFLNGDKNLSEKAKNYILNIQNEKFVSIASIWEVAIKISLGKLSFNKGTKGFVKLIEDNGFIILPIEINHIIELEKLSYYHRDPFDRIIISSAMADELTVVTKDENFQLYTVNCLW